MTSPRHASLMIVWIASLISTVSERATSFMATCAASEIHVSTLHPPPGLSAFRPPVPAMHTL